MPEQENKRAFVKALMTAARISREGGVEDIELPDPATGEIIKVRLDQEAARDMILVYLDLLTSQMLKDFDSGLAPAPSDREALELWLAASNAPKSQLT